MDWNLKMFGPTLALTMVGLASSGYAATKNEQNVYSHENTRNNGKTNQELGSAGCPANIPPAPCYSQGCPPCDFCLGPENVAGNPAVRPYNCNGDYTFTIAGFYWNAHEDGLEFAVLNNVDSTPSFNSQGNTLVAAEYINPKFKWEFGWKLGAGYDSNHDGWDFEVLWTHFNAKAKTTQDADIEDNHVLLPLFSDFVPEDADTFRVLEATEIGAHWKMKLNMVDIELGREFWNSKYLTLRPHVGFRVLWIDQDYNLVNHGHSWGADANDSPLTGYSEMGNDFKGVGVRAGLNSEWLLGRGWAFFGNAAIALVYGRFSVDHQEWVREAAATARRLDILDTEDTFRATKATTDLVLGVQYSTMFHDCRYGFTLGLAWEHHMFFNQNQLWRVNRIGANDSSNNLPNNLGNNVFIQNSGDLSTQGWTLTARFDF